MVGSVTKRFYHDGDRVLEEYDDSDTPARQCYYVWSNYIDELLLLHDDGGNADVGFDDLRLIIDHRWESFTTESYGKGGGMRGVYVETMEENGLIFTRVLPDNLNH